MNFQEAFDHALHASLSFDEAVGLVVESRANEEQRADAARLAAPSLFPELGRPSRGRGNHDLLRGAAPGVARAQAPSVIPTSFGSEEHSRPASPKAEQDVRLPDGWTGELFPEVAARSERRGRVTYAEPRR
jgi:hypothetical protein